MKWESYRRYSSGKEKWREGYRTGARQRESIWKKKYRMCCSIWCVSPMCVALISAMPLSRSSSKMPTSTLSQLSLALCHELRAILFSFFFSSFYVLLGQRNDRVHPINHPKLFSLLEILFSGLLIYS